jgi:hypothetical protein
MLALLRNAPFLHHIDTIGMTNDGEPMGDRQSLLLTARFNVG